MRSVASKSLGLITVMQIILVLVSGAGGGSEVTKRSGVGSGVGAGGRVDLTFFGQAWHGLFLSLGFLEGAWISALL